MTDCAPGTAFRSAPQCGCAFYRSGDRHEGAVSDQALADFKAAGYDSQQTLEVVLGVSLATLCNFANNMAKSPLNEQLLQYAWGRDPKVGAE